MGPRAGLDGWNAKLYVAEIKRVFHFRPLTYAFITITGISKKVKEDRGVQIFQKYTRHLIILGARRVT